MALDNEMFKTCVFGNNHKESSKGDAGKMEKAIRWVCFIASGLVVALFIVAVYLAALLPDTFFVREGESIRVAGMPFVQGTPAGPKDAVAGLSGGASYNAELTLGGFIPVKTVRAKIVKPRVVQVSGAPFGIKMFANGAMVVGFSDIYTNSGYQNPAKQAGLQMGDIIVSIAGQDTKSNEDVAKAIQSLKGSPAEVVFLREGAQRRVMLSAVEDQSTKSFRTGMWVRDSSAGIGTLTFTQAMNQTFAGLGHSIHDIDTGKTLSLLKGEIVPVEITGYKKGESGAPGELKGEFLAAVPTGDITINGDSGVYGVLTKNIAGQSAEVALSQEITIGKAQILTTIEGRQPQKYDVMIEKIALNSEHPNRNMVIRITDQDLLKKTGGIIQGMSGSPILQNGKFVGAITHVLVNDPTRGYAIFAENMLETADRAAQIDQAS